MQDFGPDLCQSIKRKSSESKPRAELFGGNTSNLITRIAPDRRTAAVYARKLLELQLRHLGNLRAR